jgi:RNA polymerase sigma-70 factor (ECF subfamily)
MTPELPKPGAPGRPPPAPLESESTHRLIERAKAGDLRARDAVFERYLPRLQRWARGRLPRWARDIADTHDLVQETLLQTFRNIDGFEPRGDLALQAYLRQALANRIRDELRRFGRRPGAEELREDHPGPWESPLDAAIGAEAAERYERALGRLPDADRELIVARVEMNCTYQEVADALGKPSSEAARKACERALVRLAEEMGRHP